MTIEELKPIIEALIFVSEEPLSIKQLASDSPPVTRRFRNPGGDRL
jgi:chromosome segregation and condensation protein ScpB